MSTDYQELENQLSHVLQELNDLYMLVDKYPNNMELGKQVRKYYWEHTEEPPVWGDASITRDNLEKRLEYLNTELAHERYWDGWTIQGMEREKKWIEYKIANNPKQLEFPFDDSPQLELF